MIHTDKLIDWGHPGKASVLVGGSFGSEGKGAIAAWLAHNTRYHKRDAFQWGTTNAGAQAGHTTRYASGKQFICYHLPTCFVEWQQHGASGNAYLNAGSIIDIDSLIKELNDTGVRLESVFIHPNATVITDDDRASERNINSSVMRVASTMKGVGSALAHKIMRKAAVANMHPDLKFHTRIVNLNAELSRGAGVMLEVPQGFGLSINHGYRYPFTTSRDCWVGSGLNDAGIHPSFLADVCMVVRTKPIRVGAVYNEAGEKLGDSGPFYPGSVELDWARDLPGVEPEKTTVTKRIRRIATWSDEQYYMACSFNRPTLVALTFVDYLSSDKEFLALEARMKAMEGLAGLHEVRHIWSTGPCLEDVKTNRDEVVEWLKQK